MTRSYILTLLIQRHGAIEILIYNNDENNAEYRKLDCVVKQIWL